MPMGPPFLRLAYAAPELLARRHQLLRPQAAQVALPLPEGDDNMESLHDGTHAISTWSTSFEIRGEPPQGRAPAVALDLGQPRLDLVSPCRLQKYQECRKRR